MQRRSRAASARLRLSFEALETRRMLAANVGNVGNFNNNDPFGALREAVSSGPYLYVVEDQHLLRTNFARSGAIQLADLGAVQHAQLTDVNGTLYFQGYDATNKFALWRSDGTVAGTTMVKNLSRQSTAETISSITPFANRVYFLSDGDLYSTDGTAAGTSRTVDVVPSAADDIHNLTVHNAALYFTAADGKLYTSNGTRSGTRALTSAPSGPLDSFASMPGGLYFNDSANLWRLDDATGQFLNIGPRSNSITESNGSVFFASNGSLLKVNGASSTEITNLDAAINDLTNFQGKLYFNSRSDFWGNELYRSDGTRSGTFALKDIETTRPDRSIPVTASSNPGRFTQVNGQLYFTTHSSLGDSSLINGVWKTDGTAAGTVQIFTGLTEVITTHQDKLIVGGQSKLFRYNAANLATPILPRGTGADSFSPRRLVELNGQQFLFGDDPVLGTGLFRLNSDDTLTLINDLAPAGISADVYSAAVSNGSLYYGAGSGSNVGLYRTDGTSAGTVLIKSFLDVGPIAQLGNQTIFAANAAPNGMELWKTDGTTGGTSLLADIAFYSYPFFSSYPRNFTPFRGQLYFQATAVYSNIDLYFVQEGWVTDGTNSRALLDPNTYDHPTTLWIAATKNYLYIAADVRGEKTIFRTDGTQFNPIKLNTTFRSIGSFTVFKDQLYFDARLSEDDSELWRIVDDGEPQLFKDLNIGPASSNPTDFMSAGGKLYFSAFDEEHGRELWQTDGTPASTILSQDIWPGPDSSNMQPLSALNGVLFLAAMTACMVKNYGKPMVSLEGPLWFETSTQVQAVVTYPTR